MFSIKKLLANKVLIFFVLINMNSYSQSLKAGFKNLSSPEKMWVIFHPFKAKKAFLISNEAMHTTDSICEIDILGKDKKGGHADAFKHSYWMARLAQDIHINAALKLGIAHEKGNYKTFKKNKLEDGFHPDKRSSEMDLFNNKVGTRIGDTNNILEKKLLIELLIEQIKKGEMKVIKKDELGNFLTCDGDIIQKNALVGKWENKKCLISSEFR